jgi:rsbT co-antagonist protein RsbR
MAQTNSTRSTLDDFFSYCADMVFIAAESGALLRRSDALTRAMSSELLAAAPQAGLAPLLHPDDKRAFDEAWTRLRTATEPTVIDARLKTADGSFRHFQCTARWVPEREEVYGTLLDVEDRFQDEIKVALLKAINDNLPICLWAIDTRGVFLLHDGKGLEAAGLERGQLLGRNMFDIYPPEGTIEVKRALEGEALASSSKKDGRHWDTWKVPIKNERGEVTHAAGITLDITDAKRTEQELRSKLELVQKQQQVIRSLAAPIIQVWDRVLTLPLVGMFDTGRAAEVMESVLLEVARTRARYAILDLTGIEAMDTATAGHLLKLSQALRLLGAEGIITGIHPAIAQTIVGLGLDLTSIVTRATLREGLQYCIQRMSREAG